MVSWDGKMTPKFHWNPYMWRCIRAVVKFLNCAVYFPDDNSEKYPGILYPGEYDGIPALSVIFQRSLDFGEIPSPWLRANITPLFKKGERTDISNYHPVSLTCTICSKLLEHIIHASVMDHFDKYSILTDKQHGFRSKNSCENQLMLTVHDLAKSLDSTPWPNKNASILFEIIFQKLIH